MKIKFALKLLLSAGLVAGIIALASPATAQGNPPAASAEMPYQAELVRCVDNADNNAAFSICYGEAAEAARTELGKRNTEMLKSFEEEARVIKMFQTDLDAWDGYEKSVCRYYYAQGYFGSHHRAVIGPRCIINALEGRIALLDAQMSGALQPATGMGKLPHQKRLARCIKAADDQRDYASCYGKAAHSARALLEKRHSFFLKKFMGKEKAAEAFSEELAAWKTYESAACRYHYQQEFFGTVGRDINGPLCAVAVIDGRIALLDQQIANRDYE